MDNKHPASPGRAVLPTLCLILLPALLILFSGCAASQAPTSYYTLSAPEDSNLSRSVSRAQTLLIEPVRLAEYLDVRELVVRTESHQISYLGSHHWGGSLGGMIRDLLMHDLQDQLSDYQVVVVPGTDRSVQRLLITIDHFEQDLDQSALVKGNWQLLPAPGQSTGAGAMFSFRTPLTSTSPQDLAAALSQGLIKVSAQIANHLNKTP